MFYVITVFGELVNLDRVQMIYMEINRGVPLIDKVEPRYDVMAQFSPKYSQRLHTGTKEQCQSAFDEITWRLRTHTPQSGSEAKITAEWTPDE